MIRRALTIDEASLGPDHSHVAIRLVNLAGVLSDMNRLAEAEPLIRRALAIGEASYGPDHPIVSLRLNNLANLLHQTPIASVRLSRSFVARWRSTRHDLGRITLTWRSTSIISVDC